MITAKQHIVSWLSYD